MNSISVLVDATPVPRDRGGVGRYVDSIIPALIASGAHVTVVCQQHDAPVYLATGAQVVSAPQRIRSVAQRLLWEQVGLSRLARRAGVDVIHSTHYTVPLLASTPRVVTIHDMTFFSHPELHTKVKKAFFTTWIRAARLLRVVAVTPSQATADEFVRITGARREAVVVAPLGYDSGLFHPPTGEQVDQFREAHGFPSRWIAFLGTLEPRKNTVALIEGYTRAMATLPAAQRPALLLAGGEGWDSHVGPAVTSAVAAGFDVRTLGYLPLEELSSFLGGAEIVAYPSLGEGFGLPVLEAMASGACVLTTRNLALPEIGGDAVAYTGTSSPEIAEALTGLLAQPGTRDALAAAGVARSAGFTWLASASRHLAAYSIARR